MNHFRAAGHKLHEGSLVRNVLCWGDLRRDLFAALVFAIALSIAIDASADETKTFTWIAPTERVDGTPLPGSELTRYELGCGSTPTEPPSVYAQWAITDPLIVTRVESFAPGLWYCVLLVYAVDTNGELASDWSNQVFFSISMPRPKPPVDLSVS